jgi:hypothetical protein
VKEREAGQLRAAAEAMRAVLAEVPLPVTPDPVITVETGLVRLAKPLGAKAGRDRKEIVRPAMATTVSRLRD